MGDGKFDAVGQDQADAVAGLQSVLPEAVRDRDGASGQLAVGECFDRVGDCRLMRAAVGGFVKNIREQSHHA